MTNHPSADAARIREKVLKGREAISRFRDATCEGIVLEGRRRDPLVIAAHDALDVVEPLLDALARSEQARQEAEQRASYEERRANTLRDERNKCTEAARLNGTADTRAHGELVKLRADLRLAFTNEVLRAVGSLARQKNVCREQNGKAVFMTGMEAAREYLIEQIDAALASTPPSQEPT